MMMINDELWLKDELGMTIEHVLQNSSFIIHISPLVNVHNSSFKSVFSHLNSEGNPAMVDVGGKSVTRRTARAQSIVSLGPDIMQHLMPSGTDIATKKGPVFQTAIIAGTMAAKRTDDLIPLCHSLGLDNCQITITTEGSDVVVDCFVSTEGKTGVEMEALVGASVAALTIYDMCKAFSHDIVIKETKLMEKTGGKRDFRRE